MVGRSISLVDEIGVCTVERVYISMSIANIRSASEAFREYARCGLVSARDDVNNFWIRSRK
jgi:hypothetical protein